MHRLGPQAKGEWSRGRADARPGTGTIIGTVVGVIIAALIAQAVLVWFCCRRQLAALLASRRQSRIRQTKGGDLDLLSTGRRSVVLDDDADWALDGTGAARRADRGRDGEYVNVDSSVSPFWDGAAIGSRSGASTPRYDGEPSPNGYDRPPLPRLQTALSSGSIEHPLSGRYDYDSTTTMTDSPTGPLAPARTSTPSSSRPLGSLTKAQLAAALSPTNPDSPHDSDPTDPLSPDYNSNLHSQLSYANVDAPLQPRTRQRDQYGERQPPQSAPRGGFRRHQDAGPIPRVTRPADDVEDLPPLYEPDWDTRRNEIG
jgi:hypothetical protein